MHLEELVRADPDGPLRLATVLTDPAPLDEPGASQAARYVEVRLQPDGDEMIARVGVPGQGSGRGVFLGPGAGDEVIVAFPGNRPEGAVVLCGLGNNQSPNPQANDGSSAVVLHPGGVKLLHSGTATSYRIVHEQLLGDLDTYLGALEVFMLTCSTAANAGQVAGAAATFMTSTGSTGVAPSAFRTQLQATTPFASTVHKVS